MQDDATYERVLPKFLETAPDRIERLLAASKREKLRSISSEILKYLNDKNDEPDPDSITRSDGFYHPSELCDCLLKAAHRRIKTPFIYRKAPKGRLRVDIGTACHQFLQGYMRDMYGDGALVEKKVWDETILISGHADTVLVFEGDVRILVEIKTKDSTDGMRRPLPMHVKQATMYQYTENCALGTILYLDLTSRAMLDFPFLFDCKIFEEMMDRIALSEACISRGDMPPAEPTAFCSDCGVNHLCDYWQLDRGRVRPLSVMNALASRSDDT